MTLNGTCSYRCIDVATQLFLLECSPRLHQWDLSLHQRIWRVGPLVQEPTLALSSKTYSHTSLVHDCHLNANHKNAFLTRALTAFVALTTVDSIVFCSITTSSSRVLVVTTEALKVSFFPYSKDPFNRSFFIRRFFRNYVRPL